MLALAKLNSNIYALIRDLEPWGKIGIFINKGHYIVISLVISVYS
jgi:hypothetical protein